MGGRRPGRATLVAVGLAVAFLATGSDARACPSGYESAESLVARADVVVEVEVVSVADEPLERPIGDGVGSGRSARALVRVVGTERGRVPVGEFTLVGGPYRSCAFFPVFLRFRPGERLCLLLEDPWPGDPDVLRISWRGRVFRGSGAHLRAMLARVHAAWQRRLDLLGAIDPEAAVEARGLAAAFRSDRDLSPSALAAASFASLATLAEILRDPTRPLPAPPPEREEDPYGLGVPFSNGSGCRDRLPAVLTAEIGRRVHDLPEEVTTFHREFLRRRLVEDLLQTGERSERFLSSLPPADLLRPDLPIRAFQVPRDAAADLRALAALLRLADERPDGLVWGGPDHGSETVDPAVYAPWLGLHAEEIPLDEEHLASVLTFPCPEADAYVGRAWSARIHDSWPERYLRYFLARGDEESSARVVERTAAYADGTGGEGPGDDAPARAKAAASRLEDLAEVAREAGDAGAALLPRIEDLLAQLRPAR